MKTIKKNKTLSQRTLGLLIIMITLIGGISTYLGTGIYIFADMSSYNQQEGDFYWCDSDDCFYTGKRSFKEFYTEKADWQFLKERALIYEDWTDEYCIAKEGWDCSTTITEIYFEEGMSSPFYNDGIEYQLDLNEFLTDPSSKLRQIRAVTPIGGYGDSPMWTGNYMASLSFHYAMACADGDVEEANEILTKLKRPVEGLHVLTHVSGLQGNLVRFAIKDTAENRIRFPGFFARADKGYGRETNRYPGQGEWSEYVYEAKTSRDQHIGYFFGNSITYKLLSTTEDIEGLDTDLKYEILGQIAEDSSDVLDCLIGSNWHVINGEEEIEGGRGHDEASLHPRVPWTSGGDIQLAFLAFGKLLDQNRYSKYYDEILNRFLSSSYHFTADQSGSYYGNNLAFESLFQAYFIEEDPNIRTQIRKHFNIDYYPHVQYHRNAFFNLGWLILNDLDLNDDILTEPRHLYKLDDITDNLDRFARWRFPSRSWYIPKVADSDELVHPQSEFYSQIFDEDSTHILNTLYGGLFGEFSDTSDKSSYALGADEAGATDFLWQRNPFSVGGSHSDNEEYKGTKQHAGIDYTLPYWMARYFGYFQEN